MTAVDLHVLLWVVHHRFGAANAFASWVMDLGSSRSAVLLLAIACATYVIVARRFRLAVSIVAAVVVTYAVSLLLKDAFTIRRPSPSLARVYAAGWSFPSTDAAITAAGATALYLGTTWVAAPVRKRLAWALAVLVTIIGVLVVYVGAHWLTDVLAGWLLGGGIGAAAVALTARFPGATKRRRATTA